MGYLGEEAVSSSNRDSDWKVYFWVLSFVKPHLVLFVGLLCCIMGISVIEVLVPLSIQKLIDDTIPAKDIGMLQSILLVVSGLVIILILLNAAKNILQRYLRERASKDLLLTIVKQIRLLGVAYFERSKVGELLSMLTIDVTSVQEIYKLYIPHMLTKAIFVITTLTVMFSIHWELALVIIPFIFFYYIFGPKVESRATTKSKELVKKRAKLNEFLYHTVSSISEIKAYNANKWFFGIFEKNLQHFTTSFINTMFYAYLRGSIRRVTINFSAVVVIMAGYYFTKNGVVTVGQFVVFLFLFSRLMEEITVLITFSTEQKIVIQQARPLFDIIQTKLLVEEAIAPVEKEHLQGPIVFSQVTFQYSGRNKKALNGVDFSIPSGRKIGIVGESGSGKTTILKLMDRFYDPTSGEISIDGISLKQYSLAFLREKITYVFQENYLFGGTIRENLLFGNPEATEADMIEAAKSAFAHNFILDLPNRYDTIVGERGCLLSGGQKQRISLARLFLREPDIVLLDEATSALDNESESEVKMAFEKFFQGKTVISVAHRLTTLSDFDEIFVIKDGLLVEQGNYKDLLKRKGSFYELYKSTSKKEVG
ncbi:putative multidrug export ATP-binding/permease protein [compost metagenome]